MSALEVILGILLIISSIVIVVSVLMQESKQRGLSGAIAGGADTFFGKNKGRTMEAKLAKFTRYFGIWFLVLCLVTVLVLVFIK